MNYKIGDVIFAFVTGLEKYGIFVSTEDEYSGLIHISEISSNYVRNVSDYAKEGELIKARILDIDNEKKHLKLSIKDLDYRINKKNKSKIEETTTGFTTLQKMLPIWISEKEEMLNKS